MHEHLWPFSLYWICEYVFVLFRPRITFFSWPGYFTYVVQFKLSFFYQVFCLRGGGDQRIVIFCCGRKTGKQPFCLGKSGDFIGPCVKPLNCTAACKLRGKNIVFLILILFQDQSEPSGQTSIHWKFSSSKCGIISFSITSSHNKVSWICYPQTWSVLASLKCVTKARVFNLKRDYIYIYKKSCNLYHILKIALMVSYPNFQFFSTY